MLGVGEFGVDQQRQRRHVAVEDVEVDGAAVPDQHQHRRGFADDASDRQQDTGDDARHRDRKDDPHDGRPFANTQRVAGFSQLVGHQPQHFLGGSHHHRQHQQDQCQRHREGALLKPQGGDPQAEDEQRRHDRGHPGQHVDHESGHPRQPTISVFHQVDGGHQAQRHGQDSGHTGLHQRPVQRVVHAAGKFLRQHAVQ